MNFIFKVSSFQLLTLLSDRLCIMFVLVPVGGSQLFAGSLRCPLPLLRVLSPLSYVCIVFFTHPLVWEPLGSPVRFRSMRPYVCRFWWLPLISSSARYWTHPSEQQSRAGHPCRPQPQPLVQCASSVAVDGGGARGSPSPTAVTIPLALSRVSDPLCDTGECSPGGTPQQGTSSQ